MNNTNKKQQDVSFTAGKAVKASARSTLGPLEEHKVTFNQSLYQPKNNANIS
jgi:hypothetical protein